MMFFIVNLLLSIIVGILTTPINGVAVFVGLYALLLLWILLCLLFVFFGLCAMLVKR
jgi:hypothetical protein